MAVNTGAVVPPKLPAFVVFDTEYEIPGVLGFVTAIPDAPADYTLPSLENIVSGASLFIRNLSEEDITLTPADGETIDGQATYTVAGGDLVWLITSGKTDWGLVQKFTTGGSSASLDENGNLLVPGTVGTLDEPARLTGTAVVQESSNDSPVTVNGQAVTITSFGAYSTAAGAADTPFAVNNSVCTGTSVVIARITSYSGTLGTDGLPDCVVSSVDNGSFTLQVVNNHDSNALDGSVVFSVLIFPQVSPPP